MKENKTPTALQNFDAFKAKVKANDKKEYNAEMRKDALKALFSISTAIAGSVLLFNYIADGIAVNKIPHVPDLIYSIQNAIANTEFVQNIENINLQLILPMVPMMLVVALTVYSFKNFFEAVDNINFSRDPIGYIAKREKKEK